MNIQELTMLIRAQTEIIELQASVTIHNPDDEKRLDFMKTKIDEQLDIVITAKPPEKQYYPK